MAGSCAYDCKKIFPHCAFEITAGLDATNLPLIFAHLKADHAHAQPAQPGTTVMAALTLS